MAFEKLEPYATKVAYIVLVETKMGKYSGLSAFHSHCAIKDFLHRVLDVIFAEDSSKIRNRNTAENMAIIRSISVNLLELTKQK